MLGLILAGLPACTFDHSRRSELCETNAHCNDGFVCLDGLCQMGDPPPPDMQPKDAAPPVDAAPPTLPVDAAPPPPDMQVVDARPPDMRMIPDMRVVPDMAPIIDMMPPPPDAAVEFGFQGEDCGPADALCVLVAADTTLTSRSPMSAMGRSPVLRLTLPDESNINEREDILLAFDLVPARTMNAHRLELLLPTDAELDYPLRLFPTFVTVPWDEYQVSWSVNLARRGGASVEALQFGEFVVVPLDHLLNELDEPRFSVQIRREERGVVTFFSREARERPQARLRMYFQ